MDRRWVSVWAVAVVAGACEGGAPPPEEAAPLRAALEVTRVHETFDGVPPLQVPPRTGFWREVDGIYQLRSPLNGYPNGNVALTDYGFHSDFTLTVRARALAAAGWNDFAVIFGWRSPDDYYFASFNEGNDGETNGIFRWRNGALVELADFSALTSPGGWQDVRIERRGQTVTVLRGGVVMGSITDATLAGGPVGLGSRNDAGDFDDLRVTEPDVPAGVVMTRPTGNQNVHGLAGMTVSAQGAVGVSFFRELAGGSGWPVAPEDTTAPFQGDFDSMMLQNGPVTLFARARYADGHTEESARVQVIIDNDCTHLAPGSTFSAPTFMTWSTDFEVSWDGLPDSNRVDAGFVLSRGPAAYFSQGSAIVRFAPSGIIDARNGAHYAAVQSLAYVPGQTTHFRMLVNPATQRYDVYARQAGRAEVTIASGFAFRSDRPTNTIDHWNGIVDPSSPGPLDVCNVRVFH